MKESNALIYMFKPLFYRIYLVFHKLNSNLFNFQIKFKYLLIKERIKLCFIKINNNVRTWQTNRQ
jgi:hypothetical protein